MIEILLLPACGRCDSPTLSLKTGLDSTGSPKARFWCAKCREHVGRPIDLPLNDMDARLYTRFLQTQYQGPAVDFDAAKPAPHKEKPKEVPK